MAKNRNFGQILSFGGSCTDPLLPMRVKFGVLEQARSARLHAKFRLDRFILSPSGGEKPQFLPFFGLRHLVVSPAGNSLRKLNTVHNYKLSPFHGGGDLLSPLPCQISAPSVQHVAPAGRKTQNRPLSNLNTGALRFRAMLPVMLRI